MEREDKRVAQLWGGRFTKETDKLVYNFNASISFDQKLYKQDMEGSIAHVKMLGKQGILTEKEMQDIVDCLKEILKEVEEGKLIISDEYEDIHSFVEAKLIDRLGDTGKKLHTGLSAMIGAPLRCTAGAAVRFISLNLSTSRPDFTPHQSVARVSSFDVRFTTNSPVSLIIS